MNLPRLLRVGVGMNLPLPPTLVRLAAQALKGRGRFFSITPASITPAFPTPSSFQTP